MSKALDRRTTFRLHFNRKLQFMCSLNAVATAAIELQTEQFTRLHADFNRTYERIRTARLVCSCIVVLSTVSKLHLNCNLQSDSCCNVVRLSSLKCYVYCF
jgi:hypothetical protein